MEASTIHSEFVAFHKFTSDGPLKAESSVELNLHPLLSFNESGKAGGKPGDNFLFGKEPPQHLTTIVNEILDYRGKPTPQVARIFLPF